MRGFERLGAGLETSVRPPGTFSRRLAAVARSYVRFAADEPTLLELMYAAKHRSAHSPGTDGTRVREAADRALSVPLDPIADAQQRGEVVAGAPEGVALAVFTCIHGFGTLVASGTLAPASIEESLEATVGHLVHGIAPR